MIMGIVLQWTSYSTMFFCLTFIGIINFLFFYSVIGKGSSVRWGSLFRRLLPK